LNDILYGLNNWRSVIANSFGAPMKNKSSRSNRSASNYWRL